MIKDNAGMLSGETCLVPACSKCGCRKLYVMDAGWMKRLNRCPTCGRKIDWKECGKDA